MGKQGQIYIRGFPRGFKESDLKDLFRDFGDIREVKMIGTAYAFVTYEKQEQGETAVDKMDGYSVDDHKLTVEVAGRRGKTSGPQPDDICRLCGGKGHCAGRTVALIDVAGTEEGIRVRALLPGDPETNAKNTAATEEEDVLVLPQVLEAPVRADPAVPAGRPTEGSSPPLQHPPLKRPNCEEPPYRRKDRKRDKKNSGGRNEKRERSQNNNRRKEENNGDKSDNSSDKDDRK